MAMNIENWIFIIYFCIIVITMIILFIYIKKVYRKSLLSVIILSILIPFNLIVEEPFLNFIIFILILSNLVVSLFILFRPLFLVKDEKAIFRTIKSESDKNLEGDIQGGDD